MAVAGCQTASDPAPQTTLELSCDDAVATSLGVPTVRRPAQLTTSGGRLRFVVKSLPAGTIFGEINDTDVWLGDPDALTEGRFHVTSSPQQPGVIAVEAGTYGVLNTNRGSIDVEVCSDVTLSDVEPAIPDPGVRESS